MSDDLPPPDGVTDTGESGAANSEEGKAESPESETAAALELRDLTREYDTGGETVVALDNVSLRVDPGESVAVIGPSGSGKSTLLNVMGLLDAPTEGTRYLDGQDVTDLTGRERTTARKEYVGFVFQNFYLVPTLTARENVEMPTMFDGVDASDRATDLLERVGMGNRLNHLPSELSGGQKQRVAIARALVNRPRVVLADEPTGNLDQDTGATILQEFERVRKTGVAVVLVTHDPLVTEYAERTVELVDGRITRDGTGVMER